MNKKILLIIVILLIVTGCSNAKSLGKRLNDEEKIINNEKINYLKNSFNDINVTFNGREEGTDGCECVKHFIDNTCVKYKCDIIEGKYKWKYNICSNKTNIYCVNAIYDDVKKAWSIDYEEDFKFVNNVLSVLESNKVDYYTYTSSGNTHFFIMIKKPKNDTNLINAIITISKFNEYYQNNDMPDPVEIIIFSEEDYNYLLKNFKNNNNVYVPNVLYSVLTSKEYVNNEFIEKKEINEDMFNCSSNGYQHIIYELFNNSNLNHLEIWCQGF